MNFSRYFYFFVFTCVVSIINSQNTTQAGVRSSKGPGISSCYYYGTLDVNCDLPVVPISCVPVDCTSYFLSNIIVDMTHDVFYIGTGEDEEYLDQLLQCDKPVYVRFSHLNLAEWTQILGCEASSEMNAIDEMEGVSAYLNQHPGITGLVLTGLMPEDSDKTSFPDLSESLKTYISVMKSTCQNLQVAISIPGWFLIDYNENPNVQWLDFTVLDAVVDFYEIAPGCPEDCVPELKNIGVSPMKGNYTYTLEKMSKYILQTKIPKDKIYIRFELNPNSPDADDLGGYCGPSHELMCVEPELSKDWCSATLMEFYEKGEYAHTIGNGFIGANIDFDDPFGCCGCNPFPAFYSILSGFNCAQPPAPCPLFDRS